MQHPLAMQEETFFYKLTFCAFRNPIKHVGPSCGWFHPQNYDYFYFKGQIMKNLKTMLLMAVKAKMKTAEAQQIYAQRSQVAEFAHAWIKERCGLRQFRCRGRRKATMEATWACLSYNLMRWFGLQRALHAQTAATA